MSDRRRDKDKIRDAAAVDHRDRRKRSRSLDHHRRTRSPDRRSPSTDRSHRRKRRHQHYRRSPSPDFRRRKRGREAGSGDDNAPDGGSKDQKQQLSTDNTARNNGEGAVPTYLDPDELEMMKKMGIPVGFNTTKGKPVAGNDVSAVRVVTKRQRGSI